MDEQIKRMSLTLRLKYGIFILISLFLCFSFEMEWLPIGYYADNFQIQYILGTIGILSTIILVPLSLKLFSLALTKKIKNATLSQAIKLYNFYSNIRLGILLIVVLMNLFFYYATLQNIGGLCGLIGLAASIFCFPNERKIKEELDLINNIEE